MKNISTSILIFLGEKIAKNYLSQNNVFAYPTFREIRKILGKHCKDPRQVVNAIYYLKARKYIKIKKVKNVRYVYLTTLGAIQFVKISSLFLDKKLTDGKKSIVIISIPQKKRKSRDFIIRKLKSEKVQKITKSIYLSNYQFSPNFYLLVRLFQLENYLVLGDFQEQGRFQERVQ